MELPQALMQLPGLSGSPMYHCTQKLLGQGVMSVTGAWLLRTAGLACRPPKQLACGMPSLLACNARLLLYAGIAMRLGKAAPQLAEDTASRYDKVASGHMSAER